MPSIGLNNLEYVIFGITQIILNHQTWSRNTSLLKEFF